MGGHFSEKVIVSLRGLSQSLLNATQISSRIGAILERGKRSHSENLTGKLNDDPISAETLLFNAEIFRFIELCFKGAVRRGPSPGYTPLTPVSRGHTCLLEDSVFESFTDRARRVVVLAQEEA